MEIKKSLKLSSKTKVQELQPDPNKKYRVHDSDQSELCILVYPSGKKSWEIYKKLRALTKSKKLFWGTSQIYYMKEHVQKYRNNC